MSGIHLKQHAECFRKELYEYLCSSMHASTNSISSYFISNRNATSKLWLMKHCNISVPAIIED
jgi:hypothetical protein